MKPESKIRRYSRCLARLVRLAWHRFWRRWHDVALYNAYNRGQISEMVAQAKMENFHATAILKISQTNN